MRKSRIKTGDTFESNQYGPFVITRYVTWDQIHIRFCDSGSERIAKSSEVLNGEVKDLTATKIYGVGFVGGPVRNRRLYLLWHSMLSRCYGNRRDSAYVGCTVVERWHNYQKFYEDVSVMPNVLRKGFQFDKDLRVLGNKVYGPRFCSFVPQQVNKVLTRPTRKDQIASTGVRLSSTNLFMAYASYPFSTGRRREYFTSKRDAIRFYTKERVRHTKIIAKKYKAYVHPEVYASLSSVKPSLFAPKQ